MDNQRKTKTILVFKKALIHAAVWILLFFLNYLIVRNYPVAFRTWFYIKTWLIYVSLFYINFLFLMPYFLFRKKNFIYIVLTLIVLFIFNTIRFRFNPPPLRSDNRPPENFSFRVPPDNFRPKAPGPHQSFR